MGGNLVWYENVGFEVSFEESNVALLSKFWDDTLHQDRYWLFWEWSLGNLLFWQSETSCSWGFIVLCEGQSPLEDYVVSNAVKYSWFCRTQFSSDDIWKRLLYPCKHCVLETRRSNNYLSWIMCANFETNGSDWKYLNKKAERIRFILLLQVEN